MKYLPRIAAVLLAVVPLAPAAAGDVAAFTPGGPTFNGVRATADLPAGEHMRNVGGSDGAGLCVPTSVEHSGKWQHVTALDGLQAFCRRRPGGSYPEKLDATIKQHAAEKGVPVPNYVQHTGGDEQFLELALRTGRLPGVTYDGRDDFYRSRIAHMVNLAHLDGERAAIIDNNRPGQWVWMSRAEFLSRWRGNSGGWAVVLLAPPPPPYPTPPAFQLVEQCGPNGCPGRPVYLPAAPPPAAAAAAPVGWSEFSNAPGEWGYWLGGVNHAVYRGGKCYAVRGGVVTAEAIDPPAPLPAAAGGPPNAEAAAENFGVDSGRVHQGRRYSITGRDCTREDALLAVGGGELADDSGKKNLAAVGDAAFLAKVRADLAAVPGAATLNVQFYSPASWQATQFKLTNGVTLRAADAPAVDRVAAELGFLSEGEYSAEKLADLVAGKKPAPKPDPAPAPEPAPVPSPPNNTLTIPVPALLFAAVVLFLMFRRPQTPTPEPAR